jgi:hypothetical protein
MHTMSTWFWQKNRVWQALDLDNLALDLNLDDLALDLDALGLGLKIVTMMEPEKKAASHPRQEVAPRRKAASHPRKELTGNL